MRAYDELNERLDNWDGDKDLYRLANQGYRAGNDIQQARLVNDRDGIGPISVCIVC